MDIMDKIVYPKTFLYYITSVSCPTSKFVTKFKKYSDSGDIERFNNIIKYDE
jgi:hypothetical protein